MRIADIEITHHSLPLDPPFRAAWDTKPRDAFDATIVRVRTEDGLEGVGSGDAMIGFIGHKDLFVGRDPLDLDRHNKVLDNIAFHGGRCWPLDLALWDLAGKILGKPVWQLVGGRASQLCAYASLGTLRTPTEMAGTVNNVRDRGFKAVKIRFHHDDWRDDIQTLEAARASVGDSIEIMVDCNQGWRMPWDTQDPWTFDQAVTVARELERLDVYWMEEPLHRADSAGMRKLRDTSNVRIAGAEMTRETEVVASLITEGCLDIVQTDAALVGGITGLIWIAALCDEHDVTFTPHTWTNGIGVIANAHLAAGAAAAPWIEFPWDPPEWTAERRDFMLTDPISVDQQGCLSLSDAPGLGVTLNEAALAETRIA